MSDAPSCIAYVGSFTHRRRRDRSANGDGINAYRFDTSSGMLHHLQHVGDLVNPSWLRLDHTGNFLYSAHGDRSEVTSFAIEESGTLKLLDRQDTKGENGVHLAFDPTNRFAVLTNHRTATLALMPRLDDGTIGPVLHIMDVAGEHGPHRVEQELAAPHQAEFDRAGRFIIVPSKGLDTITTYAIDYDLQKLVAIQPPVVTREVSGPRHVAFHPNEHFAYVVNELASTVTSYHYDPATAVLEPFQLVSCLPDFYTGDSRAAEIAVRSDGRFLYASNRGFDGLSVFAIEQNTGRLVDPAWYPCRGKAQRFFTLDPTERFILVGNEDTDSIITFRIDPTTDELVALDDLTHCGSPVSIIFKPI